MRKPSFIIGKKHIILACLTLILGIAIYMNYAFSSVGQEIAADPTSANPVSADAEQAANYGDAEFVSTENVENDYFSQVRLTRMTSRDQAVETLSAILGGGDLSDEEKATYTMQATELSKLSESEGKIESLIKAQGFQDCVVYLDGETASIVVKSEGLQAEQAAQIKDILLSEYTVPAENIRIFEVK